MITAGMALAAASPPQEPITAVIALTVAVMALMVVMLLLTLTVVRLRIRLHQRQDERLYPWASGAIARYVTTGVAPDRPAGRAERVTFRDVALQVLADLRGRERDTLIGLLEQFGYLDDASAMLTSRRVTVRRRAAELLAAMATPAAVPSLTAGLSDRDPLVRTACARALAQVGPDETVPRVAAVAALDIGAVPGAAAAVVLALARSRPAALLPLLRQDVPEAVRMAAVTVAGRLRLSALAAPLRSCLPGGDELAAAAAQGLGMMGDVGAAWALRGVASDQRRATVTRAAAITALGSIGDPDSVPLLEPMLRAEAWRIRNAAAQALSRLGEPGAAALRRALATGPAEAREHAEALLSS